MTESFDGAVVAHFESRMRSGLDGLIRRHGGTPWSAPAVSEEPVDLGEAGRAAIRLLAEDQFGVVVLLTGSGTDRLMRVCEAAGCADDVRRALANRIVVARGPKPVFALRQHGLIAHNWALEPHTTRELLDVLDKVSVLGRRVLIVDAGDRTPEPARTLVERGARVVELQVYRWTLAPDNASRLAETVDAIAAGQIDAVLFTSQVQVRHVLAAANPDSSSRAFSNAQSRVVVGTVGPTCANALRERGIEPDIVPAHSRMGHLVRATAVAVARRHRVPSPVRSHSE